MNPIDDGRLLGAVIWAAIWLIALQFGAAPAQAHPGHAHEAAAIAAPATVPTSIETIAVAADAEISAATEPRTASEVPSGRAIAGVQSNKMIADVPTDAAVLAAGQPHVAELPCRSSRPLTPRRTC